MDSIMKTLFSILGPQQQEAEARAIHSTAEAFQTAEQRLTRDEFEKMWDAIIELNCACQLDDFTLGFRMGVQLTLEGLRPVYPTDPADGEGRPYPPR